MKKTNIFWNKEIFSWAMYDFANSAFATTILAVVFNVYFAKVIVGDEPVRWLGMLVSGETLWSYTIAISMLLIVLTAPVLGAIADFSASKKKFLFIYCYTSIFFTALLFFTSEGNYILAMIFFIIANIGFAGGNGFYNAFLPEIATTKNIGRISGFGWALGYVGGGLCLLLNMFIIKSPHWFGIPEHNNLPIRFSILSVAIWWGIFAIPTFLWLKEKATPLPLPKGKSYLNIGFTRVWKTFKKVRQYKELSKFLISYLIYNDGIETVIFMSSVFAAKELGMATSEIIQCFLMIQLVAFFGSLIFGYIGDKINTKTSIFITLYMWAGVVSWAFFIRNKWEFWVLGAVVGLILGGSQSASRSLQGLFTPKAHAAEFFGFFAISGKLSAFVGPLIFGLVSQITGSFRFAILFLLAFFIIGIAILYTVDEKQGLEESKKTI